jgi:hypothetical protein
LELTLDVNDELNKSIENNTWLAPVVYFVYIFLADLVPMTSQIASMLVVVKERDFNKGLKPSREDETEGNFHHSLNFLESYEFYKPMGSETEEEAVNERQNFGTIDSTGSIYQIG